MPSTEKIPVVKKGKAKGKKAKRNSRPLFVVGGCTAY